MIPNKAVRKTVGMRAYKRTKNRALVEKIYSDLDAMEQAVVQGLRGNFDSNSVQQLYSPTRTSLTAIQRQKRGRAKPLALVDATGLSDTEFAQAIAARNKKLASYDGPRGGAVNCGLSARYSAVLLGPMNSG